MFSDFLYGQPDEYVCDYTQRVNIPYPRYWMNTQKYQMNDFINIFTNPSGAWESVANVIPAELFYLD